MNPLAIMTYREADYREYCAVCQHSATLACKRCSRPLCSVHAPVNDFVRCAQCEAEFYALPGRLAGTKNPFKRSETLSATVGGIIGASFLTAGIFLPPLIFSAAAIAILGMLIARRWYHEYTRRQFLMTGCERVLLSKENQRFDEDGDVQE